jgi:hypothetical protein
MDRNLNRQWKEKENGVEYNANFFNTLISNDGKKLTLYTFWNRIKAGDECF